MLSGWRELQQQAAKKPKKKAVRGNTGVKEKALKECCSLTITSCCQTTTVRVTGLLEVQGGSGGAGDLQSGIVRSRLWDIKG